MSGKKKQKIKIDHTQRGFAKAEFTDANGAPCSIQKSSAASRDLIWLGCDDADPKVLIPGQGWTPVEFPKGTLFTTRMHLTRKQVKALLPLLKRFARTGELEEQTPPQEG